MTFQKMDLKAWIRKPDDDSQAYRFECFTCEFYRWHVMGGLVIDGVKERRWHCVLIDDKREPCKFDRDKVESAQQRTGPTQETVEPRLPTDKSRKSDALDTPPSRDLPSVAKLDSPNLEKPKPTLSSLSKVESPRLHSKKRRRS